MQWSDVTKSPSEKMLRQFAGLCLVVFGTLAAWRWFSGNTGIWTQVLAAFAVVVGVTGLLVPKAVKPIFVGWMIAAFPIGWVVSRVALGDDLLSSSSLRIAQVFRAERPGRVASSPPAGRYLLAAQAAGLATPASISVSSE